MGVSILGADVKRTANDQQTDSYVPLSKMKSRIVRINAKPEAISIDIGKTAVIVVDMQNDFGARAGFLTATPLYRGLYK